MVKRSNAANESHTGSDESLARSKKYLRLLSHELYAIASELLGFGPYAEAKITALTGVGVESRLRLLLQVVSSLHHKLESLRADYLRLQLQSLGINDESNGIKLHIGCCTHQIEGWVNVDRYPASLAMSALWNLPFRSASISQVLVCRIPIGLHYPVEVRHFLLEIRRVLAPYGLLRILVQDDDHGVQKAALLRQLNQVWVCNTEHRTRLDYLLADLDLRGTHQPKFDIEALMHLLKEEGFSEIKKSERLNAEPRNTGGNYSDNAIYIEASRPKH